MRKIIHIDMDQFFAAVEQRDDPSLKGLPVPVGHDADRGVVVLPFICFLIVTLYGWRTHVSRNL